MDKGLVIRQYAFHFTSQFDYLMTVGIKPHWSVLKEIENTRKRGRKTTAVITSHCRPLPVIALETLNFKC